MQRKRLFYSCSKISSNHKHVKYYSYRRMNCLEILHDVFRVYKYINASTSRTPTPVIAIINHVNNKSKHALALHCLPEIVCVEESGEFWIDVDYMNIALATISDNGLVVVASVVGFNINSKGAIDLESQSVTISLVIARQIGDTCIVASSASLSRRTVSSPSRPCASSSANRSFNISKSPSNRSDSISKSDAAFAIRNFCASSSRIS